MAYAGHQFGHFVPQLGDGRAILLGEVIDRDGVRRDIQLKGSGPTPFSRRGDGRAALGPVLREYIVSEAMAALGIPTTRSLAAVMTGESVMRETMLPGAVLTRVAASHIRVGTFQFFAARGDTDGVRALADHVIARHYPDAAKAERPYRALLEGVVARQAELVARWLLVGFIHGVMNTDNTSISGETIDYGPCAFMDDYDPAHGVQLDRPDGPLRLRQPAAHRAVEPDAARRMPAAAARRRAGQGDRPGASRRSATSRRFDAAYQAGLRRKLGLFTRARRRRGAGAGPARRDGGERSRLHPHLPPPCAMRRATRPPMRMSGAVRRSRRLSTTGPRAGASGSPPSRRSADERRAAMRAVNPAFIPRNHRIEAVIARRREQRRLRAVRGTADGAGEAVRRPAAVRGLCRSAAAAISACCRRSAGREGKLLPRHCERSEAIHRVAEDRMDCFAASLPSNDGASLGTSGAFGNLAARRPCGEDWNRSVESSLRPKVVRRPPR